MAAFIRVEGLAETRRALRAMQDIEGLADVRDGLREAARIAANDATGRVPSRSGRAAGSIRPTVGGNNAYVVGGRASVPYYGWLDFGSRSPRKGNPRSRGPWAGSGVGPHAGRFIYPAIKAKRNAITKAIDRGVGKIIEKEGF